MLVLLDKLCSYISFGSRQAVSKRSYYAKTALIATHFCVAFFWAHTNEFTTHPPAAKFLNKKTGGQSDLFATQNSFIENKGQYGKTPASLSDMGENIVWLRGVFNARAVYRKRRDILAKKEENLRSAKEKNAKNRKKIMKLKMARKMIRIL